MRAVVTVVGKDRPGIIARVSTLLYENEINILDISQTVMTDDIFTMIMLVDLHSSDISAQTLSEKLSVVAEEMGLSIHVQREEIFTSMHRI